MDVLFNSNLGNKSSCQALANIDAKDAAGYRYIPSPVDVSNITLPIKLNPLIVALSKSAHINWMFIQEKNGWKYGEYFNEEERIDPNILPWGRVTDETKEKLYEQFSDRLAVILTLG